MVSSVVPLGRTFLPCLYNMELYFPPQGTTYHKRRIFGEAHKDLGWWSVILQHSPERSIAPRSRNVIRAWFDAASTQELGGYYLRQGQRHPEPDSEFLIPPALSIAKGREHINTQEMRAVQQVLLYWAPMWMGKPFIIHVNNRAVAHAIANRQFEEGLCKS